MLFSSKIKGYFRQTSRKSLLSVMTFLIVPAALALLFWWLYRADYQSLIIMTIAYFLAVFFFILSQKRDFASYDDYLINPVLNPGYADRKGNIWYREQRDN